MGCDERTGFVLRVCPTEDESKCTEIFTLPECETNGIVDHRKAVKYSLFLAGYQGLVSRRMIGENSGFAAYAVK